MKVLHVIVTTAFVASTAFSVSALAGESGKFSQLDKDGNGMISSEEAAADPTLAQEWGKADVNNDGQLERAEFSALEQKPKADTGK